jgi:hypothetical protein
MQKRISLARVRLGRDRALILPDLGLGVNAVRRIASLAE